MNRARILLLLVAVVAGGLAAYLATRGEAPPEETAEVVVQAPTISVLVANQNVGVGQRLNPAMVEWQDWPENAVRPEYVTTANLPDAPEQLNGTVARFEIFPGEPIREAKLVRTDQGYLSAVLAQGMRAVSVRVSAVSGAGGFIVPNDRVDIVQTRVDNGVQVSETLLQNVKVLAIGLRLGETGPSGGNADPNDPQSQVFQNETIATLELDPVQSEVVVGASAGGQLTLVLRSIADFAEKVDPLVKRESQSVRMIRYGAETIVVPTEGAGNEPQNTASATPDLTPIEPTPPVFRPGNTIPSPTGPSSPSSNASTRGAPRPGASPVL